MRDQCDGKAGREDRKKHKKKKNEAQGSYEPLVQTIPEA